MRVLACILALLGALAGSASAEERVKGDPVLGERLVEGVATPRRLWLRNSKGAVVAFDLDPGARRVLVREGVVDLHLRQGRPIGLQSDYGGYLVQDLLTGRSLSPRLVSAEAPMALIAGPTWALLTHRTLHVLENDVWRTKPLSAPLRGGRQTATAVDRSGRIYVGSNMGEWGGGLQRIEPRTGAVEEIRRVDGDPCKGPLGKECDPVTGLVPDPSRPDCMLASVGLSHFLAHGRILRVCDDAVEVVFSQPLPVSSENDFAQFGSWPFFGLAKTPDGWVAVSKGRLFRASPDGVTQSELPRLEPWHGLGMARVGRELLVLRTDVNWGQSLSGYTPLLVPVSR